MVATKIIRYRPTEAAKQTETIRANNQMESTFALMKKILNEIRTGQFARDWILENRAGAASFKSMRRLARDHQLEDVGVRLRRLMTWIDAKEV